MSITNGTVLDRRTHPALTANSTLAEKHWGDQFGPPYTPLGKFGTCPHFSGVDPEAPGGEGAGIESGHTRLQSPHSFHGPRGRLSQASG